MRDSDEELPLTGRRTPRAPGTRRRGRWVLLVFILALAVSATKIFFPQLLDHPIAFFRGPAGSTIYADPANGWTLAFPNSWYAQRFSDVQDGGVYTLQKHGVLLSNIDRHFEFQTGDNISWSPWFDMRGLPSQVVAVQVMLAYGGGFGIFCRHDTPLPLSFDKAKPGDAGLLDANGKPVKQLELRFIVGGLPYYSVTAWIGSQASKSDLAALHDIVGSISYVPTGDPLYGQENCLEL